MRRVFELTDLQVTLLLQAYYQASTIRTSSDAEKLIEWGLLARLGLGLTDLGMLVARQLLGRIHLVEVPINPAAACAN